MSFIQAVRHGLYRFDGFTRTRDGKRITIFLCLVTSFMGCVLMAHCWFWYQLQEHPPYFEHTGQEYTSWDYQGRVIEHILFDESGGEISHEFYP